MKTGLLKLLMRPDWTTTLGGRIFRTAGPAGEGTFYVWFRVIRCFGNSRRREAVWFPQWILTCSWNCSSMAPRELLKEMCQERNAHYLPFACVGQLRALKAQLKRQAELKAELKKGGK